MSAAIAIPQPSPLATGWRPHLYALGFAAAAILLLFYRDAQAIAAIWWNSATFNHCLLILPILGWLVAQRKEQLAQLTPAAWWPGLLLVAAGAFGWMLGEAGAVASARHLGLLFMLQGAVIAILGKDVAKGLAFPLFFALFLVPFGEELIPAMQTLTAQIASFLLSLTGVPAHLEGIFITTPTGYFQVAEACAGVKFLIAMAALGALVANVCYRSWKRRLAFVAVSLAVPILANGIRAWLTIYVAHKTGSVDLAAGFDHVVYGWFFFAIVIAIIMFLGWRFFDRGVNDPWFDPKTLQPEAPRGARLNAVVATLIGLIVTPVVWLFLMSAAGARPVPAEIALPQVAGWQIVPQGQGRAWQPHYVGADRIRLAHYRDAQGRTVDLAIIVFSSQSEGRELVGFGQGAVEPDTGAWAWTADGAAPSGGRAERIASNGVEREVLSFYRVGNVLTGSGVQVKIETLKTRLLGGPQRAVAVLVSAEDSAAGVSARPAIDDFLRALGPLDRLADRSAGLD
ncbi:exosortase A [Allosphingosinicella sp.]|uniref:exosortase A n=1 Tax=Allosphingosinicella sp. TaxID=2823234 RepID=UPI00378397F4